MTKRNRSRKLCELCQLRPVGYGTNGDQQHATHMGYCTPCLTEAEWENVHSDYGHEDPECVAKGYDTEQELAECWTCHPELNEAQREYEPRQRKASAQGTRRQQLNHRTQCKHAQTPAARRACREAYWAADSSTTRDEAPAAPQPVKAPKLEVFPARGQGRSKASRKK
jgi:hypothetical protein